MCREVSRSIPSIIMSKNTIILIGAIREGKTPICGETMKNQLFVKRYKELFDKVITVDTLNWQKRPWVLVKAALTMLFNQKAGVVLSASASVRYLIHFLYYVPVNRNVYFWVVGEGLAHAIDNGSFKVKALNKLKRILIQGQSMVEALEKRGVVNAQYVPNSKPIIFHPDIQPKNDDFFRFVFLSRVHPDKGIKEIVAASEALREKGYSNFSIDFYGNIDPGFKEEFLDIINKHTGVEYKGFLNLLNEDAYKQLSEYDMMLFPTYWAGEAFPGVVLDANIAGVPIIASDWNQNKYVVQDGKTGFIIPPRDVTALANNMEAVINGEIDLYQMKKECNNYIQQFEYRTVLSEGLFREIGLLK
jgi:glycosyltransferase involved in cell wall biosynthesis